MRASKKIETLPQTIISKLADTTKVFIIVLAIVGKLCKTGVDIKNPDPISGNMIITTKDLDELIFGTQMELVEEADQDKELESSVDKNSLKQRGCYNMYCSKEGTHRIDILNSTTLLADHEIPYFVCDSCYASFEYRRKAPLIFRDTGREVSGINPFTGQEVITTRDLHNWLEATRQQHGVQ
jgi:hypothetical protein